MRRVCSLLLIAVLPSAGAAFHQTPDARPFNSAQGRPIVVQGAMQIEVEKLVGRLENVTLEQIGGWNFWRGTVNGYPVIVSKTLKGIANAAAATVLAIERYHPIAIVNQGTAGGLDPELRLYDIVIGTSAVSLGAFKTPYRARGAGSSTLDWVPLNLMAADGSAGNDPKARTVARFAADEPLIAAARDTKPRYTRGRVVEGVIGSADMWNDELDRIARFRSEYDTIVEEMETAAAAQVANLLHTPFVGIRVVSDNITNGGAYDPKTSEACEDFVYEVVKTYLGRVKASRN
jgi:adenosylhomocysteine nucleosidase